MSAGHSPGPWQFRLEAVRTVIYHDAEIGEKAIALGAGAYPDQIANARLIAAAPELLEALVHGLHWLEGSARANALAAIAKARGEA